MDQKNVMSELGFSVPLPMVLKSDNKGAKFLASNQACNIKLMHVATYLCYDREGVDVS